VAYSNTPAQRANICISTIQVAGNKSHIKRKATPVDAMTE